jgi:hypothetical protein
MRSIATEQRLSFFRFRPVAAIPLGSRTNRERESPWKRPCRNGSPGWASALRPYFVHDVMLARVLDHF